MFLTIYDRFGNPRTELSPNDSSVQTKKIQGDNILSLSFTLYKHIDLDVDDYVDFERERYWLTEQYRPEQKSTKEWTYDLKLYGIESLLRNILVIKTVDNENNPVFTLTAPPREHVAMIVKCMNDVRGNIVDWKVGQVDGTENIVIDYHGKYCDEALREIAEKIGAEYWTEGQTVNVCRCEHGESITLGYDKGLVSINPGRADNVKFYTRLWPVGSSRNIDPDKYGHTRLQLPDGQSYVEINADKYGRIDHYEADAFADIYPRRIGTVSSVRSEVRKGEDSEDFTIYYFKDDSLPFNPNDYEIGNLVKRVSFQEGSELAGLGDEENGTYYFEVNYNGDTREFEIITIWPYGNDMPLPGNLLIPKAGDKYILWNISMPEEYYGLAEEEFLSAVNKYNSDHALDVSVFKAPTDHVWIEKTRADLFIGRRVRLESDKYFPGIGYRDSRITSITRKVNLPSQMDIEIGDVVSRTFKASVTDSIADVRSYARSIGESVALPDIIRTGDRTWPTDNNLFSARRTLKEFLSKLKDDRSKGQIATDKALEVGDFLAGVSGAKIGIDPETGQTFGEMDRLFVRIKAYFETLTIINAESLAGEQRITPGGGVKCTSVDEKGLVEITRKRPKVDEDGNPVVDDEGNPVMEEYTELVDNGIPAGVYRCYFLSEQDGEKTETKIIAGDQAIAQMFNAKVGTANKVSNHRYWRLVTAVSNDAYTDDSGNHYGYIDLSKTDCEKGSDIPQAGDEIVQFGNRNDRTRQAAMVFSTVDADAPSIKLFTGIDSYTLVGKDIVSYGYDAVKGSAYFNCYGDTFIGDRDGSTFIRYDRATKQLDIKARLSIQSTIGDKTLAEYFGGLVDASSDRYKYLAESLERAGKDSIHISGGLMLSTMIALGYTENSVRHILSGMNGSYNADLGGRTIASWYGGEMLDLFDENDNLIPNPTGREATSLIRMDGSVYFAAGNAGFCPDGSGWLGNKLTGIKFNNGSMTFGSGVRFDVENVEGLKTTLETLGNFNIGLSSLLIPCDANGVPLKGGWAEATKSDGAGGIKAKGIKATVDFFSDGGVTALGHGSGTGGGGGTGGGLYGLMTEWTTESAATRSDALGANLGWELHTVKLDRAEAAGLYQPKGNYLTSHQSLAHLLKVDGSNGTASGVSELIRKLDGSVTAALTDATLIVTSNANGEASDHKYYRRPASALWSYVKDKAGSEWVTISTAQTITGMKTFSHGLKIGNVLIEADANGDVRVNGNIYATEGVTALGSSGGSSSGGTGGTGASYSRLDSWADYTPAKDGYVLSAKLGRDLYDNKLSRVDAQSLYQPKGNYLTSHQSLAHLLKVDGSNGTASGVSELIRKLDGSVTAALTDATLIVTSNANGEASDHKYYRRPASALWSYVRGKGGSEWVTVSTAQTVTGKKTFDNGAWAIKGVESSEITSRVMANSTWDDGTMLQSVKNGIDFSWYDTHWVIGNIRNDSTGTRGFGIGLLNSNNKLTPGLRVTTTGIHATAFIKSGGTDKQVLMADGSVQTHWKAADMASANTDNGMITPKAMNVWTTKTFVTALGTSGNYLTWTKNGVANNITVPYATGAGKLNASVPATLAMTHRETMAYYGGGGNTVADKPSGVDAFGMLSLRTADGWQGQLLMASNTAAGLYWRTAMTLNGGWRTVLDSVNYAGILDSRYVTLSTAQTITGMKTFSHGLKIGNVLIEADANGDVRVNGNIYATGGVTALGSSGGSSSGGTGGTGASYSRLDSWADYTPAKDGYVLSAKLGRDLYDNKLSRVDAQSLFQPKGSYVTLDTAQTITGAKTFGSNKLKVVASDPSYTHILRSTNTAIPTSERDYAWQIYHATEGSGFRGLSIWSYDGDSKVFNQVATFKAHGGNKLVVSGSVYATSLIRSGGTSAQFLKADGSVDSNSYLTTGAASSAYVKKAGDVMTGMLTTAGLVVPRDKYVYGVNESGGSMLHFDGTRTVVGSIGEHSTAPTHLRSKTKHLTCGDNGTSYTVWDSGNDGSGSGLDADLLDGTHKSGLFTGLSNNGATNNLSVTVGGVSKEVRVSAVGGYLTMTVSKNDNYGRPVYLLIADVTTWYNTTTSGAGDTGIVGYLYGRRGGNLAGTSVQKIIAWCSYNNSYYRLQSDTDDFSAVLPRIVRYNGKYYLALYMRGSGRDHCFIGFKSSNLLSTFITVNADSSGAFEGLTVVHSEEGMAHFGNASTATKLETARTLWGRPFDGTANVSGNMTGVGDINTASAPIGTVYSSNWFRSTGSSGWRSETYGGGWYMQDSTWIRSLGNKGLYMGTGTVRTDGSIVVGASEVFKVDPSGNVKANTLKIGRAEISWDEANTALKISTDVYSVKGVTALGSSGGATGGGGGASYGLIRNWGHTPAPTESTNDALGANLGWDLDRRLRSVESGAAVTVSTTGSGNAVTAISKSGTVITATKGATFLTKSEADSGFVKSLGTSGDYLTWVKNGVTNNITVPFATKALRLFGGTEHTGTELSNFDTSYTQTYQATNDLGDGISYSAILSVSAGSNHRYFQIIGGKGNTNFLRWRTTNSDGSALGAVHRLLDDNNYSTVLDSRYYTKSEVNTKLTDGSVTKLGTATVGSGVKPMYLNAGTPTASASTVGAANRPVYMNAGTITAGTYTFGNASGNAPISNGTVNTNLNADMLDGYHITNYQTGGWTKLTAYNEDSSTNYARYSHKLFKVDSPIDCILRFRVTSDINYPSYGEWVLRVNHTTNYGKCVMLAPAGVNKNDIDLKVYVDSDFGVWVQTTAIWNNTFQFRVERGSLPEVISTVSGTPPNVMHTLVNVGSVRNDGTHGAMILQANAQSATKLQTARTLWGQSFDGSGNVSGSLSGVGTITGSGTLVLVGNSHIYLKCGGSDAKSLVLNDSAFKPFDSAGGRLSLGSASARWSNTYSVLGNFSGLVTASAGIRIGEATISWDADKLALRIDRDVYSDRGVTALGSTGSQGGPSGGGYGRYEDETWAKAPASGDVLAAKLGVQLHNRVKSLEGKNYLDALNLTTTGGGNAVTAVSLSADKKSLTVTKGASFSLSDHRHGLLHHDFATTLASTTTDDGWSMINSSYHGFILKSLRMGSSAPGWVLGNYAAGVCFGGSDTKGVLSCSYSSPAVRFAGGNGSKPVWHLTLTGTSGATYNLANLLTSASAESTFVKKSGSTMTGRLVINGSAASQPLMVRGIVGQDGSGTVEALYLQYGADKPVFFGNGGTHNISADGSQYSGNSATATALKTARSINGTSFNGSADITTSHWGSARNISIADSASANTGTAVSVNGSANVTLKLPATIKAALAGNASSATQLQTARRLTIGGTGKDFNGTAALSWSLDEIGVYSKSAADGRFVNVTGDSMTGSLNMVNGAAKVNVTDGAGADDGYGFVNVTRKNESADLAYFSMVKAGVGAYGIGVGPGGMILGSAVYSSDGKRTMNPWLTLDGSAMTVQGDILPASNNVSKIGSPKAGFFRHIYANNVSSEGEMTIHSGSGGMIYFDPDGLIAVNHDLPEYEFDIKGTMRADNILSNGGVTALKSTTTSDMRLKKVLGQLELRVEDIAGAPSFVHLWRHETPFGDEEQAGTSAQYWLGVLPQAVDRSGRWLALDYGKTALLSAIALARRSQTHEERIAELEAEVERLRGMLGKRSA